MGSHCNTEAQSLKVAAAAEQLQQALCDQDLVLQATQQHQQAATDERDALRSKVEQQRVELTEAHVTAQDLRGAAADLADELQAVRSASGRHAGQHTALRELSAEHAACLKELTAKSAAVDDLNASVTQLRAELADNAAQQAQHEQDSTGQQAEFVGQVLQELQVLEYALLQKGEECDSLSKQCTALRADSDSQLRDLAAQLDAHLAANQQLRQDLKAQRAQRQELAEKVLALDAQAAYKQHKLDALATEAATSIQCQHRLQAELDMLQQQLTRQPQSTEASTSTSDLDEATTQRGSTKAQTCRAKGEICGDQAHAHQTLEVQAAQQQPPAVPTKDVQHMHEALQFETDALREAEEQCTSSKQSEQDAAFISPQPSTDCVQRLEGKVADLQSEMLATKAQRDSLQQQLTQSLLELDAAQASLVSHQHATESLQQRLTQAESDAASAQAQQQHWSQQAAADRQSLLDLQHQLAAAQEDKAALLALPQPEAAAEMVELQQAVKDLERKLADQSSQVQTLKAAAQVAEADNKHLLNQFEQAQQAAALAEEQLEQLSTGELAAAAAAQEQLQEQLQQDRDSLMEEVLSAKARAADQERVIQSLRVAADASAREMMLLSNQLDATEQQFASQAQELLQQQREAQQLHAALTDQTVHLKKAKFKGSSNDQDLRGMQQRLQEALQDRRAAELQVQSLQRQLQEAEQALSQASYKTELPSQCQYDAKQLQMVPCALNISNVSKSDKYHTSCMYNPLSA